MSMLAERKRKQRFTLNPRGKLWTEDTNSFGQKMLKRMGWKNGKGLGANENGSTEPLRVSYKNDSKGMGYKETEQWTAHDENFSSLLEALNGNKEDSDNNIAKVNSLEAKGQSCRTRINYHKFTKAKDISKYTEKDLANILGKKTLKEESMEEKINEEDDKITNAGDTLEMENDLLLNKGSMVDYFKKKLPSFTKRTSGYVVGNNGVLTRERSDSESDRPGFGFSQENNCHNGNINGEESLKKKKRKYAETFFSYLDQATDNIEELENVHKKKSKRNKSDTDFMHEITEDDTPKNYEENVISEKKNKNKETVSNFISYVANNENDNTSVEKINDKKYFEFENMQNKKKKKNKSRENDIDKCKSYKSSLNDVENCHGDDVPKKKKKKKNKDKCKDNESICQQINEQKSDTLNEDVCRGSSKNKFKESTLELSASIDAMNESTIEEKKKKKKKKKILNSQNETDIQIDQENCEEISHGIVPATCNKRQKKHKKKTNEEDAEVSCINGTFHENNQISINTKNNVDYPEEYMCKKEARATFKSYLEENHSEDIDENNTGYVSKKKLKKKKCKNLDLEDSRKEKEDNAEEIRKTSTESASLNDDNKNVNEDIEGCSIEEEAVPKKAKKQKKSKKNEDNAEDNTKTSTESASLNDDNKNVNEDIEGCSVEEEAVPKKAKKQKKSKKNKKEECDNHIGISNPAFNDLNNSVSNIDYSLQIDPKSEESNLSEDTPKKKKKKRKLEEVTDGGIDNPLFREDVDNLHTTLGEGSSNPYEVKVKRKKTSNEEAKSLNDVGLDNPALNLSDTIPDTDLILNIASTPTILKKPEEKINSKLSFEQRKRHKRKSVRFSDVLQQRIIPIDPSERSNEYISNRNELFDINTLVVEDGIREEMKKQGLTYQGNQTTFTLDSNDPKEISKKVVESSVKEELNRGLNSAGFINNGFDIRSVDKVNFYESRYEVKSPKSKGIDNKAFNKVKNHIEENVESISTKIEKYQAEVENNINEAKVNQNTNNVNNFMVGDVGTQIDKSMAVPEGTKLCFKEMKFNTPVPFYIKDTLSSSKKSYRHLIRGDITVAFKNSNLHDIKGYSVEMKEKLGISS